MKTERAGIAVLLVTIAAVNAVVYLNTLCFSFTNWDDATLILNNALIRRFTWESITRVFSTAYAANYTPLHLVSYTLDYRLWGLNPMGYHLSNVILHAAAACLLLRVAARITGSYPVAFTVALLFSVHPAQSETVAWVAERKNILFTLFVFQSFLCRIRHAAQQSEISNPKSEIPKRSFRTASELWASFWFVCALLSKPAAIVYPVLLVAYDCCCLKRPVLRGLLSNAHFFLLSAVMALVTLYAQRGGGIVSYYGGSFLNTQITMLTVHIRYLRHLIMPIGLSPVYDVPIRTSLLSLPVMASALFLATLVIATVVLFLRKNSVAFWLIWYLAAMLPVSNIVPINTLMADRYLYFADIGIFGGVAAGLAALWRRSPFRRLSVEKTVLVILAAAIVPGALAARQNLVWQNSMTLWTRALEIAPGNPDTHHHLAGAYLEQDDIAMAEKEYRRAIELQPDYTKAHINLSHIYSAKRGDDLTAIALLEEAIARGATIAEVFYNLGVSYYNLGNHARSRELMEEALRRYPYFPQAYLFLGNISFHAGNLKESIAWYERALEMQPDFAAATNNLVQVKSLMGE